MNCPFCQSPFNYEPSRSLSYYQVKCSQDNCRSPELDERLFFGFADNYPDKTITDYSLLISMGNLHYTFTSIEIKPYSSIEYSEVYNQDHVILTEWKEWIPLQENLDLYIAKIQRWANLKAFW